MRKNLARTLVTFLAALAVVCLWCSFAYAADADGDAALPAFGKLINMAIEVVGGMLLVLAPWFAHRLIKVFEAKTGVKVPEDKVARLDSLLFDALNYADEQSHKSVKQHAKALTMSEKREYGVGYVVDMAESYGIAKMTREKAIKYLEVKCQQKRLLNGGNAKLPPAGETPDGTASAPAATPVSA